MQARLATILAITISFGVVQGRLAAAQITGGATGLGPIAPAADERVKVAKKFAEYFIAGRMGDCMTEMADLPTMFGLMFRDDWNTSPDEEKAQIKTLYLDTMNMAYVRPPDEPPLKATDFWVGPESDDYKAKVTVTFKQDSGIFRFVVRMEKQLGQWRLVDGYPVENIEKAWVQNVRGMYARFRGETTPLAFIRRIHKTYDDMRAGTAATQPAMPGE